jgi:hypothetical protein
MNIVVWTEYPKSTYAAMQMTAHSQGLTVEVWLQRIARAAARVGVEKIKEKSKKAAAK